MNDSVANLGKYFLPYQVEAILCEGRLFAWEKSIRIGATYAMAFKHVRDRVRGRGDYLHQSMDRNAAREFIGQCKSFMELFNVAAISMGEMEWDKEQEETAFYIRFDNGCRIIAFSSNPNAARSFGGSVGLDEFAFSRDAAALMKAAGGRAMWGHNLYLWTSHNGYESKWNKFLIDQRAKIEAGLKCKWHIMRTTLLDAVEQGLVEKVNQVSGTSFTREEFIEDTKELVGSEEAFAEECLCEPRRAGAQAIKWQYIEAAKQDYDVIRSELTTDSLAEVRSVSTSIALTVEQADKVAVGYDVARRNDLASVFVNARHANVWRQHALVNARNVKFATQRELVRQLMRNIPGSVGAGDETGQGMQVCEELQDEFGQDRFACVNFSSKKSALVSKMVMVYEDERQQLGRGQEDLYYDLAAIKTETTDSGRLRYYETRNPVEKNSHCDMAYANGLALLVGEDEEKAPGMW